MNRVTISRIVNDGLADFQRNFLLSAAAAAVMALTLFVITALFILRSLVNISLDTIQDKVDISVYFKLTTSEQTINQIKRQAELLPEIASINYIPPVEAKERFKELHKDEPLLLESVEQFDDDENPFPASFAIRVRTLEDYPTIINLFKDQKFDPFIQNITDKQDIVDRLGRLIAGISNSGLLITVVFSLITILVMFNTIRLTIYNRKEEIEIMKLVGASNGYVRGPFIVGGVLYALTGTFISTAVLFLLLAGFYTKITVFLGIESSFTHMLGFNIWWLVLVQLIFGMILAIVSSFIAIRRHLRI